MAQPHSTAAGEGGAEQNWRALRALLPFLWPAGMRWRVVAAVAFLVLGQVGNVAWPLLFRDAVDALSPQTAAQAALTVPVWLILGFGGVRIAGTLGQQLRAAVFARVAQRAIRRVAAEVFDHLTQLGLSFHLARRTGGLTRALDRGSRAIDQLLSVVLFNLAPTILEILFVCGVLWATLGWLYAGLTLLTVALYVGFTMAVTQWRLQFRRQMNDMDSRAGAIAVDSLLNIETVKAFANEALESRRYDRALAAYEESAVRTDVSLALLNIGQGVILSVGMAGITLMAGFGVAAGALTVGSFAMVTTYLLQLARPLNLFGTVYRQVKQSLTDMETLFALLDEPVAVENRPDAQPLRVNGGAVSFRGVAFAYSPDRPVLRGIDLAIPAGGTAAVVGPTGAGKSTLTRLLLRFYDPMAGTIDIDGQDIAGVTQESLRRRIGVVPQDTVLFNDTIAYNIAYGYPEASRAEIARAAELAQLDGFIAELPQGYETLVGERGLKLSGGEKQRVAIARAILKDPPILIFDEATSSLDSATERAIQASLARVSAGRTTLMIAHRLSTVSAADEIAVLDRGTIVERGTHAELLARQGRYAVLWQRQQHSGEAEGDQSRGTWAGSP